MYHDFPDLNNGLQEALIRQCEHINRYYHVVTMNDIVRSLREKTRLPPNALAVTVDDGNRDFLIKGYPIFHRYKIPVTVYLVSGFLDRHLWFWWDQISYALEKTRCTHLEFSLGIDQPPTPFPLDTLGQRQHAILVITRAMKKLTPDERIRVINNGLTKRLNIELPHAPPEHLAPLEWSEVRHLAENGVEFGAHTVTHPVLSLLKDPQELTHEIQYSKQRLEEELRRPVLHFCYPYGMWDDFNDQTVKVVKECQFQTAVAAESGLNSPGANPFTLKRLAVDPLIPEHYFRELLVGLHPLG